MVQCLAQNAFTAGNLNGLQVLFGGVDLLVPPDRLPFNVKDSSVLIVSTGYIALKLNKIPQVLHASELVFISQNTLCEIVEYGENTEIGLLAFSTIFAFEYIIKKQHIDYFGFFITKNLPKVALQAEQFEYVVNYLKLLSYKTRIKGHSLYKEESIQFVFNLLLYELAALYSSYCSDYSLVYSRKENLLIRFLKILDLHCKNQHGVKFYADFLCITTGHLTKVVKQVSGKTVKQFIESAIIAEAKLLLENSDLTISQITDELQFCNVSFFSNFFKKRTRLSPSEYRYALKSA